MKADQAHAPPRLSSNAEARTTGAQPATTARGERNLSVDVAKGIGILLVVLGHNSAFRTGMRPAYEAVYLFHVPLFFFLSGVTFKPAHPVVAARKRVRGLLVPYFAMGLLAVTAAFGNSGLPGAMHEAAGVLYGTGHTLRFTPLWFLPCLFAVSVTASLLLHRGARLEPADPAAARTKRFLGLVALAAIVTGLALLACGRFASPPFQDVAGRPLGLPWSLDLLPLALGFFLAGVLSARAHWLSQIRRPLALALCGLLILVALVINGVSLDLNYRRATDPLAVVPGVIAGIALVLGLSGLIRRSPWLTGLFAHLGSASLLVLIFHGPLQRRSVDWLSSFVPIQALLVLLGTGLTVAVICVVDLAIVRRVAALSWIYHPGMSRTGQVVQRSWQR